ncbi:MAG: DUF4012 domain-containing protein, partial [Actinomycetota bacterium]|nr:DUF4012 domain-containing protein [Actinomycetota bacterium]
PLSRARRVRAPLLIAAGVLLLGLLAFGAFATARVARPGVAGKQALLRAEVDAKGQQADPARRDLAEAAQDFKKMQAELHSFGPLLSVARVIPVVRVQVRAVEVFARAGANLSQAGLQMVNAADTLTHPTAASTTTSPIDRLRTLQVSVHAGVQAIDTASAQLDALGGYRLLGPLGQARNDLSRRLITIGSTAHSADDGLTALIAFTGGSGPKRYLVLSQNPDELRPTGGFIGSYGVLTADAGQLHLDQFAPIESWVTSHPTDLIPLAQLASPFRFYNPPLPQSLANVNATPDWPQVAQSALNLWRQGGQAADGVVSFTPEFMARVLSVVGPVDVPSYGETVTADNVVERLDYYTHIQAPTAASDQRKAFLPPLGQAVMAKLVSAPVTQWRELASALGQALSARQLLVWSPDAAVESTLSRRGWAGALPPTAGDFFYNAEFEYSAKNGRGIKRTIDHQVTLRPDGSARLTTTITFANTLGTGAVNLNPLLYVTVYGPTGATVDTLASDLAASAEPAIAGHPAAGWFLALPPNGTATLKMTWNAPAVAIRQSDGSWRYQLHWLHVVDNPGDVLNLKIQLPGHGRWKGAAPPLQSSLTQDLAGTWTYHL